MTSRIRAILWLSLWVGFTPAPNLHAQEQDFLPKLLDPLARYNPFDPQLSNRPHFFPDEVDRKTREALIHSLTHREEQVKVPLDYFQERDRKLLEERQTVTGLTEHILDLYNNRLRNREAYLAAQEDALESASSEQRERILLSRLRHDELNSANQLLKKSRTNWWGGLVTGF